MFQRSFLSLVIGSLLVVAGVGCTKSTTDSGGSDAGVVDAGNADGGTADAGDGKCHSQNDCPANQYCELKSGECLNAKPCAANPDTNDTTGMGACEYQEDDKPTDYCFSGGCYCDLERNGGTCLPRAAKCGACESDLECGKDPLWYRVPAKCVDFTPTTGGASSKVCLPAPSPNAACPSGYLRSTDAQYTGLCIPAGGACDAAGACTSDDECDAEGAKPNCQVSPGGYCVPACTFDWRTGESACPNGKVCHMDMRLTQPVTNRNFGAGHCDLPCDVENGYTCPDGEECVADGPTGAKRCRPPAPSCIRDEDCAPDPANHTTGFCNLQTFTCEPGCRKASHCATGFACVDGECTEKTCVEQGGAIIACVRGQFCCGEPGGPTCPTGVDYGKCYGNTAIPWSEPWCADCSTDNQFIGPTDNLNRPSEAYCAGGKQWNSCDIKGPAAQCPQGFRCTDVPAFCETDADCGVKGKCGDVQMQVGPNTQMNTKACICDTEDGTDRMEQCPATASSCGPKPTAANPDPFSPPICLTGYCDMKYCGFP